MKEPPFQEFFQKCCRRLFNQKWKTKMEKLYTQIKELIIEALNLEDISTDDIETEAPLFVDGLGLDSIDALELGMAIKQKYGLTLSSDNEEMKKSFYSVKTLAEYINANR
ncbi:acyl carrier protein [Succinivibrio sp. AGMB01872]|uniref:Acyl carrier protein n=2 Tax=Succinivibrio faecicola TaxID=2820300 RepID=A0ABS7DDT4_9GAMM|nr:acyl carrier protein [Succinivibrio faecicola]